jgi:hypothetical protein
VQLCNEAHQVDATPKEAERLVLCSHPGWYNSV